MQSSQRLSLILGAFHLPWLVHARCPSTSVENPKDDYLSTRTWSHFRSSRIPSTRRPDSNPKAGSPGRFVKEPPRQSLSRSGSLCLVLEIQAMASEQQHLPPPQLLEGSSPRSVKHTQTHCTEVKVRCIHICVCFAHVLLHVCVNTPTYLCIHACIDMHLKGPHAPACDASITAGYEPNLELQDATTALQRGIGF